MESSQNDATSGVSDPKTPLAAPLDDFLDDKATVLHEDGSRSGSYAVQLERVLPMWIEWMEDRVLCALLAQTVFIS